VSRPGRFAPDPRARAIDLYRSSEGRTIAEVALEQVKLLPSNGRKLLVLTSTLHR
jgi:hypothetical protein